MRILGIIPARGGSKGVPRKNIQLVAGKPLIAYTIEAAKGSRLLTRFVTSTDDVEIAEVARSWGSEVLMRPAKLAADDTPMVPVMLNVLEMLEAVGECFEYVALLQPTAPMRTAADVDGAIEVLLQAGCDSVVSVYRVSDHHPARMYRLVDGHLEPYDHEPENRLRQSLPPVYHRNGAVYVCRSDLLRKGILIGPQARPYVMSRERSISIDDQLDLAFADWLLRCQPGQVE